MTSASQAEARPAAVDGPSPAVVDARLAAEFGTGLGPELDHSDAYQLLIATVLSAQTTDVRVNAVTAELFPRFPDAAALADASEAEVEALVAPLGMGPTRARRIVGLARQLLAEHAGEVPDDQSALEALPGVGRKTAHVVRGVWFGHSLLAVDTHVTRLAQRLGWTTSTQARTVEEDVRARAAQDPGGGTGLDLTDFGLRLILLGRRVCTARAPRCGECVLADLCPKNGVAP